MKKIAELANLIKQAGVGAVDASSPVNIIFGEVTKVNPLEVTVNQRFALDEDFLIVPESLTEYLIDVSHTHSYSSETTGPALPEKLLIRRGLEVGDALLLLRMQGGQQYIILDRVL
ncbi:MAG: hypothetical protein K0Q73_7519 [Paenibacillus sp.]|jgi:hypothetical protein|nr:hypothetical protein [Paenibacillus sp.]